MSLKFSSRLEISAPPDRVFAALADVDAQKHWMSNWVGVERLTPGKSGLGERFKQTRKMFGRPSFEVFEVTAWEPGRRLALFVDGKQGTSGKGEFRFIYTMSPTSSGTTLVMEGDVSGGGWFMEIIGKLFIGSMKKALMKDLNAFKAYVERA